MFVCFHICCLVFIPSLFCSADDFVVVRRRLTFSPLSTNPSNITICFDVHAVPDKLVEQREDFSLVLNSRDIAVKFVNTVALVTITDEDGKSVSYYINATFMHDYYFLCSGVQQSFHGYLQRLHDMANHVPRGEGQHQV